ncbi:MAG TPA: glutaredoxin family protein [Gemmatimonadales bacterium]|jgi:glutaredoxin|nr:glutaredoxin family protein [Gemmatimonadales bacterium]
MPTMKQECPLVLVWLTWVGVPALALLVGIKTGWAGGVLVLMVGVAAQVAYLRWFPRMSRMMGYGSVADVVAGTPAALPGRPRVTLYTASVCPFCPIMRRRLASLRRVLDFELEEIDVTFRPELVRRNGFRSVPVIEAAGMHLVGNATSADLTAFLTKVVGQPALGS